MPIYTFECSSCQNQFDEMRRLSEFSEMTTCPECRCVAHIIISQPILCIMKGKDRKWGTCLYRKEGFKDHKEKYPVHTPLHITKGGDKP